MIDYEKKPIEFIVKYVPYKEYHGEKWICVPASYRTEAYFLKEVLNYGLVKGDM